MLSWPFCFDTVPICPNPLSVVHVSESWYNSIFLTKPRSSLDLSFAAVFLAILSMSWQRMSFND